MQDFLPLTIDLLLENSCSSPSIEHKGYSEMCIELHCVEFWVIAKQLGNGKYEILEYNIKDC